MTDQFISFEGIEGVGKTTLIQCASQFLEQKNARVLLTREPGGTPLAEAIRTLLLHPPVDEPWQEETELLLMFASRVQHVKQRILPALEQGMWVVSDRFVDASFAYQGGGRCLTTERIQALSDWCLADLMPGLTFLLDAPPAVALARMQARAGAEDRIEREKVAFFERVRAAYLARAQQYPERIKVIDTTQSLEAVQQVVRQHLHDYYAAFSA